MDVAQHRAPYPAAARIDPGLRRRAARALPAIAVSLVVAAALVLRLPLLANSSHALETEEAVDALAVRHLLSGGEWSPFSWGTARYGIVQGLVTAAWVPLLGWTPLALKLGAFVLYLAGIAAIAALAARLYGRAAGVSCAALLIGFSPELVRVSTTAGDGLLATLAWGALTLAWRERQRHGGGAAGYVALGAMVGFGLYLSACYAAFATVVALDLLLSSFAWAAVAARTRLRRREALRSAGRHARLGAATLAGVSIGLAPWLWGVAGGLAAADRPLLLPASPATWTDNARVTLAAAFPALFGADPARRPELEPFVGTASALGAFTGLVLLAAWAAAWVWGVARSSPPLAEAAEGRVEGGVGLEALLVLLPPVAAVYAVISPDSPDAWTYRQLMPAVVGFAVLAAGMLAALGRRSRAAAAAVFLLLTLYPVGRLVAVYRQQGYWRSGGLVVRVDPVVPLLYHLRDLGVDGAYAWHWLAYKAALLGDGRPAMGVMASRDRRPEMTSRVDDARRVAYVFDLDLDAMGPLRQLFASQIWEDFRNRIDSIGDPVQEHRIGPFVVYVGEGGRRLLPPDGPPPVALQDPRAEIHPRSRPRVARAGTVLALPVLLVNRSDAFWSATGLRDLGGGHRVAASYRWYVAAGQLVEGNGRRSLLPHDVPAGGSLSMVVRVPVPEAPGEYLLDLTLVQENVAWFDDATGTRERWTVEVR